MDKELIITNANLSSLNIKDYCMLIYIQSFNSFPMQMKEYRGSTENLTSCAADETYFYGEFSNKWTKIMVVWETDSGLSKREILLASD